MARVIKTIILLTWLGMLGFLLHRTYFSTTSVIAFDAITEEGIRTGSEWFGIYQKGRKIGYAKTTTLIEGNTYHFLEESEMDILALGKTQRVRTEVNAYSTNTFLLKYFDFKLASGPSTMSIRGAVVKKKLVLDITTGGTDRKEKIRLKEPVYLTTNILPAVVRLGLEPGKRYRFPLFNPATMSTSDIIISVADGESIKVGDRDMQVYRLKETFQEMETDVWITPEGETLKEVSPLGFTLLKETREEAMKRDAEGPAVDIISLVKIRSRFIENSGATTMLRARLGGAKLDGFDLDGGRQKWRDDVVRINVADGSGSYLLPYSGAGHRIDLSPTALVQSDDKAIREEARKIIDGERDAQAAAKKLNTWVYEAINKQPVVSIPSAVDVLRQRVGDCNEHTTLYTALARAVGLPARMAAGVVYLRNGFYYHAWPEIWLGRWVAVDPTFNQFPADATHIRFVTGELSRQAEIMRLVGKLKIDVIDYR